MVPRRLFVIKTTQVKGLQVAPAELEGCLLDHPDISNACVVGIPDAYCAISCLEQIGRLLTQAFAGGELPLAFVVLSKQVAGRLERDPGFFFFFFFRVKFKSIGAEPHVRPYNSKDYLRPCALIPNPQNPPHAL